MGNPILVSDLMRRDAEMKTLVKPKQRRRDERKVECEDRLTVLLRIAEAFRAGGRTLPSHIFKEIELLGGHERAIAACKPKDSLDSGPRSATL